MSTETSSPKISKNISDLIDLSQLILGFSSAALLYLNEKPADKTGKNPGDVAESASTLHTNLALAKYNIDIIELIQKKSNGNLTPDEDHLIKQVLTDLRLKYSSMARNTDLPS